MNRSFLYRIFPLTAAVAAAAWLFPASVSAFAVRPGAMMVNPKPGQEVNAVYEVENDSGTVLKLRVRVRDSHVLPENKDFRAEAWLEPQFKELIIPPHSRKKAKFRVHTPKMAKGELAALVSFIPDVASSTWTAKSDGVQTRLVSVITVSCYVWIKGTERGEADLGDIRVSNLEGTYADPAQVAVTVVVKNGGNVHQRPSGSFRIVRKGETSPVYEMQFPSGWPVMPNSDHPYEARTPGALAPGQYQIQAKVMFGPEAALEKTVAFTVDRSSRAVDFQDIP